MNAIRVRRRVDSDMLQVPELKEMLGKTVEIIILEETPTPEEEPRAPDCFSRLSPIAAFEPSALETMRGQLTEEQYEALSAIAGQDLLDVEAIRELRAASMI